MIRALRPTDILAYLAFRRLTPDSEALTRADGATVPPTFKAFLSGSFALEPSHERWVSLERGRIVGLIAARARPGADVWDVDQLIAASTVDSDRVYLKLLEHLCCQAVEAGVQKVFLRLREDSDALPAAHQAGFLKFTTESVYLHDGESPPLLGALEGLRPRRPADHQAIFQLYSAVVPAFVRQVEGLTLQEWRWTDGWRTRSMPWRASAGCRRDFVVSDGAAISAWLRIDAKTRLIVPLVAGHDPEVVRDLLAFGLANLGPGGTVALPLREYQVAIGPQLEELGFVLVARHALLAKALALRVPEGKLVPIRAS